MKSVDRGVAGWAVGTFAAIVSYAIWGGSVFLALAIGDAFISVLVTFALIARINRG